jgi:hypothetical protein
MSFTGRMENKKKITRRIWKVIKFLILYNVPLRSTCVFKLLSVVPLNNSKIFVSNLRFKRKLSVFDVVEIHKKLMWPEKL